MSTNPQQWEVTIVLTSGRTFYKGYFTTHDPHPGELLSRAYGAIQRSNLDASLIDRWEVQRIRMREGV